MKRAGATAKVARTAALLGLGVFLSLPQWALGQQVSLDLVDLEVYPRIKIYTTVMDRAGKPLCDLTRGDFALEEAGEPRRLRVLSGKSTETSIGILLDESGSMGDVIGAVRRAAGRFVELLGGTDRAATYSFASSTLCTG
jgi:hypothetical protein